MDKITRALSLLIALGCLLVGFYLHSEKKDIQAFQGILFQTDSVLEKDRLPYSRLEFSSLSKLHSIQKNSFLFWLYQHRFERFINQQVAQSTLVQSYDAWRSIPKKDRPDLMMEQSFLMTLDPALGYVPDERRLDAYLQSLEEGALITNNFDANNTNGIQWQERGPSNFGGRTRGIMFDPNDASVAKVWAGGVAGGLWFNNDIRDPNSSWQQVNDFWANLAITSIAYDPSNPNVYYVGTGEGFFNRGAVRGGGIWKSSNQGRSWTLLDNTIPGPANSLSDFAYVHKIVVDQDGRIFAATRGDRIDRGGILRSDDGGATWTKVLAPRFNKQLSGFFYDFAADIELAENGDLYASFGIFSEGRIFRSTDQGNTWTDISPNNFGQRIELALAPSASSNTDNTILYAVASGNFNNQDIRWFKKSLDGGATWQDLSIPLMIDGSGSHFTRGQAYYNLILKVHPQNPNIVFAGGIDLHTSFDGGNSWRGVSHWFGGFNKPYVHADQHNILFRPDFPSEMIFSNDGGVYYSSNAGVSANPIFEARNLNYNVTQFYSISQDNASGSEVMLGGTQDHGTQMFSNIGINMTQEVLGGDGGFTFIDEDNPQYQISSLLGNSYYRSLDGGISFNLVVNIPDKGKPINPTDYDDKNDILYAAGNGNELMRYKDFFGNIEAESLLSSDLKGGRISSIIVSKYVENQLYVGTDAGRVFRVDNAHQEPSFTEISGNINTFGYVASMAQGANSDELVAIYSNYGVPSVWYSNDGGQLWTNKDQIGFGLPDMPIRWAMFNPNQPGQVFLATELGVWVSDDIRAANPDWKAANNGLANVRCDMLSIRPGDQRMAVATHGRGVFTTDDLNTVEPGPGSLSVSKVYLVNADSDQIITELQDGSVIELDFVGVTAYSILAQTEPNENGSVIFNLTGASSHQQIENVPPYTLFGDKNSGLDYEGQILNEGNYTINITPYAGKRLEGAQGVSRRINFSIQQKVPIALASFSLIDATTNQVIQEIADGDVIDLAALENWNLSIRANTQPLVVGSVEMELSGIQNYYRVENASPYALFGDTNGDYSGVELCSGGYTLRATPYSEPKRGGLTGQSKEINFEIVGSPLIESITFLDANSDTDVFTSNLQSGDNIAFTGDNIDISFRANSRCAQSVKFLLRDDFGNILYEKIESALPFTLFGDNPQANDYLSGGLKPGNYILTVTPYSGAEANGNEGVASNLEFTLKNEGVEWEIAASIGSTGTSDIDPELSLIKLYPNPLADEIVYMVFSEKIEGDIWLEIRDSYQYLVYSGNMYVKNPQDQIQVNLNPLNLRPGIYYFQVSMADAKPMNQTLIKN